MYSKYAEIRDKANMNDSQVAEKSAIPPSTIYDWKQRSANDPKASMSVSNLLKIADVLGCQLTDLIGDK